MDSHMMDECIVNCMTCHRICVETLQHCLQQGGRHAAADHIGDLTDCAQICSVSADFMARRSDLHAHVCGVCAEACERCASSCENVNDSAEMQRCVDACRACAESCRHMASAAHV